MLHMTRQDDGIIIFRHNGEWTERDLGLYHDAINLLIQSECKPIYLLLDFSNTTRVNPNRMSEFLSAPYWGNGHIGLCTMVCSRPLRRFVQQILQLLLMRQPNVNLCIEDNLDSAEATLKSRQLVNSTRSDRRQSAMG